MVFSSVPLYLDPPNWPNHHQQGDGVDGATGSSSLLVPPLPPPPGGGPVRPGSMTERARLAKIPLPEAALKCPRCDSSNTKFCYFNNYSLSQPRHFCKTCRRYWTRGGALRNVPVGGGCRRNKRSSKVSRSKSPARGEQQSSNGGGPLANPNRNVNITRAGDMLPAHFPPHPPFLQSLSGFAATPDLGLHYIGGNEMEFQEGNNSATAVNLSARFADLFRLQQGMTQQLPFLSGLDQPPPGGCLYQFEEAGADQYGGDQLGVKGFESGGAGGAFLLHHHHHHQPAAGNVKMEDNMNSGMNISRNFLGISGNNNNDNFWTGNNNNNNGYTNTDLLPAAGYASSTTSRLL